MNSRTYYDILGVSREATLQEITSAKNALAKVYHPSECRFPITSSFSERFSAAFSPGRIKRL